MSEYCPKCGDKTSEDDSRLCVNCQATSSLVAKAGSGHVEVKTHEAKIGDEFWMGGKLSRWIPIESRVQQIGVSISGYLVRRKASGQNS